MSAEVGRLSWVYQQQRQSHPYWLFEAYDQGYRRVTTGQLVVGQRVVLVRSWRAGFLSGVVVDVDGERRAVRVHWDRGWWPASQRERE